MKKIETTCYQHKTRPEDIYFPKKETETQISEYLGMCTVVSGEFDTLN